MIKMNVRVYYRNNSMFQACSGGMKKLLGAAEAEDMYLQRFPFYIPDPPQYSHLLQDAVANSLLRHFHSSDLVALQSTGDGNCLFNSLSILLIGNEDLSVELRCRVAVELAVNRKRIMRHPLFHKLSDNKDFEEDILRCPKPGSYSSMNVFLAAASMLRMPIDVVYPAVNSASSYLYRTMNCRIEFAHTSVARSVSLM